MTSATNDNVQRPRGTAQALRPITSCCCCFRAGVEPCSLRPRVSKCEFFAEFGRNTLRTVRGATQKQSHIVIPRQPLLANITLAVPRHRVEKHSLRDCGCTRDTLDTVFIRRRSASSMVFPRDRKGTPEELLTPPLLPYSSPSSQCLFLWSMLRTLQPT